MATHGARQASARAGCTEVGATAVADHQADRPGHAVARMDPLPLHRYRLAGELTEIRASDLAAHASAYGF